MLRPQTRIGDLQGSLFCALGLVKFVPAVARLLCLALPGSFLTMFAQNKGDLCKTEVTVPSQETSIPPQHELAFNLGGTEIGKLACLLAWIPRGLRSALLTSYHPSTVNLFRSEEEEEEEGEG